MGDGSVATSPWEFWAKIAQTLGIPTVVMGGLLWWANATINYERERMLPTIEGTKVSMEQNSQALKDNSGVMRAVKSSLDRLNKTKSAEE